MMMRLILDASIEMISRHSLFGLWPIPFLLLTGCATDDTQWTAKSLADYKARKAIAESGKLLHDETASPAMFQLAQNLGIRSDGVYWRNAIGSIDTRDVTRWGRRKDLPTDLLRFCEDGSVVGVVTTGYHYKIKEWLRCDPVDPIHPHGVLKVDGSMISFRLHMTTGAIDYEGTVDFAVPVETSILDMREVSWAEGAQTYGKVQKERYQFHRW